jgi:PAS domain S-box-containing protein
MDDRTPDSSLDAIAAIGDELYSGILQLSPDAIAIHTPDLTHLIMANQQAVFLHGYDSLEEVVGRAGSDFIHPDDIARVPAQLELLRQQGTIKNLELRLLRKDGTSFPADIYASLVRSTDGTPRYIIIIARDLSEQRRLEASLREREARLSTILAVSHDGFLMVDPDKRVLDVNDAYCRMVGYDRQELLNMTVNQLEVVESPEAIRARTARIMERGNDLFLANHRRKDGSIVVLESCMNHHPSAPGIVFGFLRDITERATQERELRIRDLAIHASLNGMAMISLEKRLTYVNPSFLQIWGFDSPSEVLGRSTTEFWKRPEDCEAVMAAVVAQGSWTGTLSGRSRGGDIFPVELRVALVKDSDGTPLCSMATFIDITDRQKAEEENRRLKEELEERVEQRTAQLAQSNRELESFCYSVSHDLRTPLRAIAGFCSILREKCEGNLDPEGEHSLNRIEQGAKRLGELIDDLLALSRVSRHEMALKPVDMSALCNEILEQLASAHPDRQVRTRITPGVTVLADPILMRQTLHNLLENAWKYTSRTPDPFIEFDCREADCAQICSIRDNGAGFDMTYADKLFGTFQRLHGVDEFEGTGIGLATVKRVIERHGGDVWGEGEPGGGATFTFSLPIRTKVPTTFPDKCGQPSPNPSGQAT